MAEVTLKCTRCNKEFQRKSYRIKKGKRPFCSHSCQVRYGVERLIETRPKADMAQCTCTNCGTVFEILVSALKNRNKKYGIFCRRKCYEDYLRSHDFRSYISLVCSVCGNEFTRLASTEKSNRKNFQNVCCSRACSSKVNHATESALKKRLYYQLSMSIRQRDIEVGEDVDEEYLLEVWKSQGGKCPYSGHDLLLKPHRNRGKRIPYQASIDRIDSSIGYVRGNIEFVSLIANMAKNVWSRDDVISFCREVTEYAKR